jgi:hypothetical protein
VTDEAAYGVLTSRWVSFLGPPLTRRARGSLSVANITMIDRRQSAGWGGQLLDYIVSVNYVGIAVCGPGATRSRSGSTWVEGRQKKAAPSGLRAGPRPCEQIAALDEKRLFALHGKRRFSSEVQLRQPGGGGV